MKCAFLFVGRRPLTTQSLPVLRNPSRERSLDHFQSIEQRPRTAGTHLIPKRLPASVQRSYTMPPSGKKKP